MASTKGSEVDERPRVNKFGPEFPKHNLHSELFEAVKRNDVTTATKLLKNPDIDVNFHDKVKTLKL